MFHFLSFNLSRKKPRDYLFCSNHTFSFVGYWVISLYLRTADSLQNATTGSNGNYTHLSFTWNHFCGALNSKTRRGRNFRIATITSDIVFIMNMIFVKYTDTYTVCLNRTFLNIFWVFHMKMTQPLSLVSKRIWFNYKLSLGWQTAFYIRFLTLFLTNSDILSIMRNKYLINKIRDHINFYASKRISSDQELIQSDPTSCPQNQKGNN